ncbi:MAG: SIMPL domain-containing protein [Candidatus Nitrosopolaris sp.]
MVSSSSPPNININMNLLTVICILAAASVLSFVYLAANNYGAYARAQQSTDTSSSPPIRNTGNLTNNNILSTSGTGITKVKPDNVLIALGVETTNKTAKAALSTNSATVNRVLDVLLAAGVKRNETSTSAFSISPNYNYSKSGSTKITGFTVDNPIQIESSNINNTGKWIGTAISSGGATTVNSIDFTLSDKKLEEIKNGLIKQAIDSARSKADIAASTLGLKILGVKSISLNELEGSSQPQPILQNSVASAPALAGATPIISGEQQVSITVTIDWLIK